LAENQLDQSNRQADRGNWTLALELLEESRRIAVAVDDPPLLVETALAYSNIYYYLGKPEEALAFGNDALNRARNANDNVLIALCTVSLARNKLLSNKGNTAIADEVKHEIADCIATLPKQSLHAANAWITAALAEKELGNFAVAERSLYYALAIHSTGNYLELAAYDYYLLASVASVQSNYGQAIAALQNAIALDRRAENSHGLGMNYLALGDVYKKARDTKNARNMYTRAATIFKAARMDTEARRADECLSAVH
jgi:tetratricopeptide (TPR) repeat protein